MFLPICDIDMYHRIIIFFSKIDYNRHVLQKEHMKYRAHIQEVEEFLLQDAEWLKVKLLFFIVVLKILI